LLASNHFGGPSGEEDNLCFPAPLAVVWGAWVGKIMAKLRKSLLLQTEE
jgi:hypothetical protein